MSIDRRTRMVVAGCCGGAAVIATAVLVGAAWNESRIDGRSFPSTVVPSAVGLAAIVAASMAWTLLEIARTRSGRRPIRARSDTSTRPTVTDALGDRRWSRPASIR